MPEEGDRLLALVYRLAPHRFHRGAASAAARLGRRLLDVGGGAGHLARALEELGATPLLYVAADPDPLLLRQAAARPWAERVIAVGEALPLRSGSMDVAVFHDSLHHIPRPWEALREAARVARCILVDDVDASSLPGRLVRLLERLSGYPATFTTPGRLVEELERLGLEVLQVSKGGLPGGYRVAACRRRI